ncbi:EAL domain-containing protein [Halomonas sp. MCCC 1A17488]|uniref:EAL domain-containing protein n=1 Tax=Billgrantia sulfidoxydans TaxID=2733484 RepID=A0ABX7W7X7_9GAMM|nr:MULTISPECIES: EAL domain-containing protein [Halomonas]MCE8017925.1 EAL domain-containing protein [Halomonas sp. MCCC 1A17488]MCG3241258.1 EAL domain-containing protein [Halomonas sp. MCCC 1A17488]QPP49100.1 EAL domain-containing protein [Halomonas sp. SS10-MC5]QTP56434.1 EAL domain-containing protein [Halomonas sulfidoxydans]
MRPSFALNRPLIWAAMAALPACIWLPSPGLRMAAVFIVVMGLASAWRQIRRDRQHADLMQQALMLSEEGVQITDAENRILAVNPAFTRITGFTEEEVRGLNAANLAAARHDPAFFKRFWQTLHSKGRWEGEIWNRRKQGDEFPEWLRVKAITDARGHITHYVGTFTDISVHKAREQDLRRIGFEDPLTGLPNRRRLHDLMTSRLRHLRAGESLDMAIVDIDGFKSVNDSLGVEQGDRLLARFGQRLARHVAGGVVGRLGGDEFLVIRTTTFDDHDNWVAGLRQHLGEPFELGSKTLRLGLSIGSCRAPEDGKESSLLFQRLESALYSAKRHGRNVSQRFRPALDVQNSPHMALVYGLRDALANGDQLELHYQTQHRIMDGAVVGMEALLRWRHPEHGIVSPADFIPLAERHGLMGPLGNWVIDEALAQMSRWRDLGLPQLPVWINISAIQMFQGELETALSAGLARHGIEPAQLGLELTESVLLDERAGDIVPRLEALRAKGHRIAIDDFGMGYSSLSYLKNLPLDKLKLDRAFIRSLPDDPADAAIVSAVLAMARGLGLDVVAEGVETHGQLEFLRQAGCRLVQGYLYARPGPADVIEAQWRALTSDAAGLVLRAEPSV